MVHPQYTLIDNKIRIFQLDSEFFKTISAIEEDRGYPFQIVTFMKVKHRKQGLNFIIQKLIEFKSFDYHNMDSDIIFCYINNDGFFSRFTDKCPLYENIGTIIYES